MGISERPDNLSGREAFSVICALGEFITSAGRGAVAPI